MWTDIIYSLFTSVYCAEKLNWYLTLTTVRQKPHVYATALCWNHNYSNVLYSLAQGMSCQLFSSWTYVKTMTATFSLLFSLILKLNLHWRLWYEQSECLHPCGLWEKINKPKRSHPHTTNNKSDVFTITAVPNFGLNETHPYNKRLFCSVLWCWICFCSLIISFFWWWWKLCWHLLLLHQVLPHNYMNLLSINYHPCIHQSNHPAEAFANNMHY